MQHRIQGEVLTVECRPSAQRETELEKVYSFLEEVEVKPEMNYCCGKLSQARGRQ